MGLLGGALMGGVVGHEMAKRSGSAKTTATAAPVAQVVENGVPDAHGCYKQTIKEPVVGNGKLYTETVHLVCPHGSPPSHPQPGAVPAQVIPVAQSPVVVHHVVAAPDTAPTFNHTHSSNSTHSHGTQTHTVLGHPGQVPGQAQGPAQTLSQPSGITVLYAAAPVAPSHHSPPAGAAHVVLLSKTVKKQKSAAATLNVSHGLLILLVLYCLIRK
ncbi:uncharacterized protein LOC117790509 [Drosophila innubila]|uniref:uncharacterized protein LOC117790509 n=1 Tax=Drosophila innubila TaxID=198719 RepID=UPI00148CBD30|nr:uncharacterized protein LOC117790509 [Drosophila innubila]